jgi:hypothetical protein
VLTARSLVTALDLNYTVVSPAKSDLHVFVQLVLLHVEGFCLYLFCTVHVCNMLENFEGPKVRKVLTVL